MCHKFDQALSMVQPVRTIIINHCHWPLWLTMIKNCEPFSSKLSLTIIIITIPMSSYHYSCIFVASSHASSHRFRPRFRAWLWFWHHWRAAAEPYVSCRCHRMPLGNCWVEYSYGILLYIAILVTGMVQAWYDAISMVQLWKYGLTMVWPWNDYGTTRE